MAINLSTQFSARVLEKLYATSVTQVPFNMNYDVDFIGNQTVKIWTVDIAPLNDYDNTEMNGSRYGELLDLGDTVQEHTMNVKKSTRFIIDNTFNTDQKKIKRASTAIGEWYLHKLMPYKDKYTLGVINDKALPANKLTLGANESIYDKVIDVNEKLDETLTPEVGRIMWATPEAIALMKKDENFVGLSSLAQDQVKFKGQIGEIDGLPIIKTRKMFMPDNVLAIVAHPSAVISPIKIDEAKIVDGGDQASGSIGVALVYFDTFVLEGREGNIAVISKAAGGTGE